MAATKFRLYKDALRHLADARLSVITDDNESRYALDDAYSQGVEFVLRQAAWRFALKTAPLVASSGPLPGFTNAFAKPGDWLRTHALFVLTTDGRERPIDIREQGSKFSANRADGIVQRYISRDFLNPDNRWPEHFAQVVSAYLAFLIADRVTGEHGAAGRMSQLFSSLLESALVKDAIPENVWLPDQLDGTFIRVTGLLANQGFWRFALKTVLIETPAGAGEGGLLHKYGIPDDQLMTRELYQLTAEGQHRPFDIREHGRFWHTNAESFYAQYLSTDMTDRPELWPDQFLTALQRALEYERATIGDMKDQETDFKLGLAALANAEEGEAIPDNPWLEHQLSGAYARCMPAVIARGFWRFAMKTIQLNSEVIGAPGGQDTGFDLMYPYRFPIPADWVQTHALFIAWNGTDCPIDIKELGGLWLTATPVFLARYVTTDAYDARLWPESLAKAVLAYLEFDEEEPEAEAQQAKAGKKPTQDAAAVWGDAFSAAFEEASLPRHPWTRHQLNGSFLQAARWVLEQGRWRFAIRSVELNENFDPLPGDPIVVAEDGTITAPAQHGYASRFIKPNDWLRTIWFGRQISEGLGMQHIDTDYIDEGYTLHANWSPLSLRYLSVERGLDPTQWTAHFRDGLLAYLEHLEARGNPKLGAIAAERFKFFQQQLREAEVNDDTRDGPVYRNVGRIVRARYGWGRGYGIGPGYGPAQGWWG